MVPQFGGVARSKREALVTNALLSGTIPDMRTLLILGIVCGSMSHAPAGELEGGVAAVDITPTKWPLHLRGSFRPQLATSAHDPLMSRALVLGDGETRLALVVVDSCMVDRDLLDRAKARAAKASGIPADKMLISSTHTHSAPFANASNGTPEELAYQAQLENGIASSIVVAAMSPQAVSVATGGSPLSEEVFNRRWFLEEGTMPTNPFGETTDKVKMNPGSKHLVKPAGPTDPEVSVLAVKDRRGKPLSLYANYSLHYVGNTGGEVSADYFGEFASLIRTRLRASESFVGMLSNGTSGDINNINFRRRRPPRQPFEQIKVVASKTADAAYRALEGVDYQKRLDLGMVERELTLRVRVPTEAQIAHARDVLRREEVGEKIVPGLAPIYARRMMSQAKLGAMLKVPVQAVRIGDLAICAIPFETLVEIGLELKERSPFADTFTVSLANGGFGYLPTPKQHSYGGYETWLCTNKVEKESSEIIVKNLLEMLAELKGE